MQSRKSSPSSIDPSKIPQALLTKSQWVLYQHLPDNSREGKARKVPYQADMVTASVIDPSTWNTFEAVKKILDLKAASGTRNLGVGFVFQGDGLCGIDLDDVVSDDGRIHPEAVDLINQIPGYKEYSPSGKGIHIITLGIPPWTGARQGAISVEVYTDKRYFTITTNTLPNSLSELDRPVDLTALSRYSKATTAQLVAENDFLANLKEPDPSWTIERVKKELLDYLPDFPYPTWRLIACALHHQFGGSEEGYELFDDYSSRGDLYAGPTDTRRVWDSIRDVRGQKLVTIGTLIHLAQTESPQISALGDLQISTDQEPLFMRLKDAKRQIRSIDWLIDKHIKKESLVMIGGAPGSGKSYVALDMALSVATGKPWLEAHSVQQGEVILVACEGRDSLLRRVWSWEALKNKGQDVEDAYITPTAVNSTEQFAKFIEAQAVKPKMIVLDTMNFTLGSCNENDSNLMTEYFTTLSRNLIRRFKCVVVLVHHTNKGKTDIRGSSAIRGALDALYFVDQTNGQFVIENDKHKDRDKGDIEAIYLNPRETQITLPDGKTETNIALFKGFKLNSVDSITVGQRKLIDAMAATVGVGGEMQKTVLRDTHNFDPRNWSRDILKPLIAAGYLSEPTPKTVKLIKTGDTPDDDFAV
jgi:putative DNA primase/helicase